MNASPTAQRVASIDVFRGLTILVMVFVNHLAGVEGVPAWAKHMPTDADAMSFVDAVFPAFLFIVGMSIPFALSRRDVREPGALEASLRHVLARATGLVVLGVFMVNAEDGHDDARMAWPIAAWSLGVYACAWLVWGDFGRRAGRAVLWRAAGMAGFLVLAGAYRGIGAGAEMTHQWWGILGLIGWSYLVAATAWLAIGPRIAGHAAVAAACVALYAVAQRLDGSVPAIAPVLDQASTVIHAAITACGVIASLLLVGPRASRTLSGRATRALAFAALLLAAGFTLRTWYPISKNHASPSWCALSAAACVVIALALHAWLDVRRDGAGERLHRALGAVAAQPLVTYLLPFVIDALMTLADMGWAPALRRGTPGVVVCVLWTGAVWAVATVVTRRVRLRL